MEQKTVWIILAAVLGTLVLALVIVLVLFSSRRSKKKLRVFSLRAVTPLDDAVFESWRRPSQYPQRTDRYGTRPSQLNAHRSSQVPDMMEKEMGSYKFPRPSSPSAHSIIRKPERTHRKSSCASSIADRPPTPYSPSCPPDDFKPSSFTPSSFTSFRSMPSSPRTHYPSNSETSAFDFEFHSLYDEKSRPGLHRSYSQSTRPLNLSFGFEKV